MTAAPEQKVAKPPRIAKLLGAKPIRQLRPGIRFGETMTGRIALRVEDPAAGYADQGAMGAVLRAEVYIDDLDSFIDDPHHRGKWTAVLDIPMLGGRLTSERDDFRLFRRDFLPSRQPVREMVYDATLTGKAGTFRMEGRKYISPGGPWRAWPATTTLHVRLFDDDTDTLVASGQLRLSVAAFARQLLSIRATGRVSWLEKPGVLRRFVKFFAGALVRTYVLGRRW